jgi:hypothetical protein
VCGGADGNGRGAGGNYRSRFAVLLNDVSMKDDLAVVMRGAETGSVAGGSYDTWFWWWWWCLVPRVRQNGERATTGSYLLGDCGARHASCWYLAPSCAQRLLRTGCVLAAIRRRWPRAVVLTRRSPGGVALEIGKRGLPLNRTWHQQARNGCGRGRMAAPGVAWEDRANAGRAQTGRHAPTRGGVAHGGGAREGEGERHGGGVWPRSMWTMS